MEEKLLTETNQIPANIANLLLEQGIFQFAKDGPVRFVSGILSPVYCDNRLLISRPKEREQILNGFTDCAKAYPAFDALAGTATAGIPWASWLAQQMQLPLFYVRGKAKEHGKQKTVEGGAPTGKRVLLIEDLITTGSSSLTAAKNLAESGAEVVGILAIFSYGFSEAKEMIQTTGLRVESLTDLSHLIAKAAELKHWDEGQLASLRDFAANPRQ